MATATSLRARVLLAAQAQLVVDRPVEPQLAAQRHAQAHRHFACAASITRDGFSISTALWTAAKASGRPSASSVSIRTGEASTSVPLLTILSGRPWLPSVDRAVQDLDRRPPALHRSKGKRQNVVVQPQRRVQPPQPRVPPRLVIAVVGDHRTIDLQHQADRLGGMVVDPHLDLAPQLALGVVGNHHPDPQRSHHPLAEPELLGESLAPVVRPFQVEAGDVLAADHDLARCVPHIRVLERQLRDLFPRGVDADLPAVVLARLTRPAETSLAGRPAPISAAGSRA